MFHNSLFAEVAASFHESREVLLRKWPHVRPLCTNMGRLDTMSTPPPTPLEPAEVPEDSRDEQIADLRRRLEETEVALDAVLGSRTWRMRGTLARMVGRT